MSRIAHRNSYRARVTGAFTLVELLVGIFVLLLLVALLLPAMPTRPKYNFRLACMANLKQVALASILWAEDHGGHFPAATSVTNGGTMELVATGAVYLHFQVFSNYLHITSPIYCKADKTRTKALGFANLTDTNVSYFVALDATTNAPSGTILAGDRNLNNQPSRGSRFLEVTKVTTLGWNADLHNCYGNVGYADGNVEGFSRFRPLAATTNMIEGVTNRLAIP